MDEVTNKPVEATETANATVEQTNVATAETAKPATAEELEPVDYTVEAVIKGITFGESDSVDGDGTKQLVYFVRLDKEVLGYKKVGDEFVLTKIDSLQFQPKFLPRAIANVHGDLGVIIDFEREQAIREGRNAAITASQLGLYLNGAKVTFKRSHHLTNETYTDFSGREQVYEHTGYTTEIVAISLSAKGAERVEKKIDKIM